ncbi:apolipoprotein L3-like, partial [Huso huso]
SRQNINTVCKVYKGINHFLALYMDRDKRLQQYVNELQRTADGVDRFHKGAIIGSITGGAIGVAGGIATITGLILAPFTFGASVIVTAVGLGVASAGGLTSASASISDTVKNNSYDRKRVEEILAGYQKDMAPISECLNYIQTGMEKVKSFDISCKAYSKVEGVFQAGARAGKGLSNIIEIVRVVQMAKVAGGAVRAVRIAGVATGILSGLFLGLDVFFIAKDAMELRKGAKTEFAAKIREGANELQAGLDELNKIRDELQETVERN